MRKTIFFQILWFLLAVLTLNGAELQIIATGDIHGKIYDFARLAREIKKYPEAVKIDLGDLFHGESLCDVTGGKPMIAALNALKYEIFIPGNHEFELAPERFVESFSRFNGSILGQFKISKLKVLPWKLIERNGFRCAVIGMTDNGIFRDRRFYPELQIIDEISALNQTLAEIRKIRVDAVVLARHGGDYFSGAPAGRVLYQHPEIDLMICSHTHREIPGMRRGKVLIVQPGQFAASAVLAEMRKDPGKPLLIRSRLLRPGKIADKTVAAIGRKAYQTAAAELKTPLFEVGAMPDLADRVLAGLKQISGADCAVVDLPELPEGMISKRDFLRRFPYRNKLAVIECSPEEYVRFCREKVPGRRKRFASAVPAGKKRFTMVLNTFQLSRSKVFPADREFRLLALIERDVILKVNQ